MLVSPVQGFCTAVARGSSSGLGPFADNVSTSQTIFEEQVM